MPMAPLCNPQDFFCGGCDETGLRKLFHTAGNQRAHDTTLAIELHGIEGERIASPIGQRREVREPLRVIEHADHPQMIEETLCSPCIDCTERHGKRSAGTVEGYDFGSPKIVGFYGPIPLTVSIIKAGSSATPAPT